jgi:flagellar basal-body rod protein FlgB
MAGPIDALLQFHTEALGMRAQRQQLLASNIANADTPGYKARDMDFAQSLRNALGSQPSASELTRTNAAHVGSPEQGRSGSAVLYRTALQPSLDDNTVDMDVELSQFAENAVHYEANLTFINHQLKLMLAAIQG